MISQYALKDYYVVIEAEGAGIARQIMYDCFGNKWAFMYDSLDKFHKDYYPKGALLTIKQQQ
jgi:hypothetical protein